MTRFFPLFIDISQKTFLIIGGGNIATRRLKTLIKFGPAIILIAPIISKDIFEIEYDKLSILQREYKDEDIDNSIDFVLAATNNDIINTKIINKARKENIPANNCKNKSECDFYFPAIAEKDELVVGICASGMSHRKARFARELIEKSIRENCLERESSDD